MCSVTPGSSTAHFRKAALTSVPWIPTSMSWTKASVEVLDVAVGEVLGEEGVLRAVDPRAHDELDPGLGDHLAAKPDVAAEVHAGGIDDRPHPVLHRPPHLRRSPPPAPPRGHRGAGTAPAPPPSWTEGARAPASAPARSPRPAPRRSRSAPSPRSYWAAGSPDAAAASLDGSSPCLVHGGWLGSGASQPCHPPQRAPSFQSAGGTGRPGANQFRSRRLAGNGYGLPWVILDEAVPGRLRLAIHREQARAGAVEAGRSGPGSSSQENQ